MPKKSKIEVIKTHCKKAILLFCTAALLLFGGCSAVSDAAGISAGDLESSADLLHSQFENQKIAKIEVLAAGDSHLIRTIDDRTVLAEFVKKTASDLAKAATETESSSKSPRSDSSPNTVFVVYKNSAVSGGDPEEIYRLTTFADSSAIQVKISSNAVKSLKLPEQFLTFSFQTSDSVIEYLNSLAAD
ncbi:hypothetical protein [Caproicibacter sp.]|uniref:hypothetical protein n=1 Tax=Caproicibacter sp. TaxID=2814884 RepID=UPI003989F921